MVLGACASSTDLLIIQQDSNWLIQTGTGSTKKKKKKKKKQLIISDKDRRLPVWRKMGVIINSAVSSSKQLEVLYCAWRIRLQSRKPSFVLHNHE